MKHCETVMNQLAEKARDILKDNLTGVYLHGSAAMGCFHPAKSDIDIIIVINERMTKETKKELMDCIVELNAAAPAKGLEISVVMKSVCKPFAYPTPFELHFSPMHLNRYRNDPVDYIEKMHGLDKDLAAHFTVINHRGKCLAGFPIDQVFGTVPQEYYMDSIWEDVKNARAEITENALYLILNLARVLAYKENGLVLSKKEGGEWARNNLPIRYRQLVSAALSEYNGEGTPEYSKDSLEEYAEFMLSRIHP